MRRIIPRNRNVNASVPRSNLYPCTVPCGACQFNIHAAIYRRSGYFTREAVEMDAAIGRLETQIPANIRYGDAPVDGFCSQTGCLWNENLETDRPSRIVQRCRATGLNMPTGSIDINLARHHAGIRVAVTPALHPRPYENLIPRPAVHRGSAVRSGIDIQNANRRHGLLTNFAVSRAVIGTVIPARHLLFLVVLHLTESRGCKSQTRYYSQSFHEIVPRLDYSPRGAKLQKNERSAAGQRLLLILNRLSRAACDRFGAGSLRRAHCNLVVQVQLSRGAPVLPSQARIDRGIDAIPVQVPTGASRSPHCANEAALHLDVVQALNFRLHIQPGSSLFRDLGEVLHDVAHLGFHHMKRRGVTQAGIGAEEQRHVGVAGNVDPQISLATFPVPFVRQNPAVRPHDSQIVVGVSDDKSGGEVDYIGFAKNAVLGTNTIRFNSGDLLRNQSDVRPVEDGIKIVRRQNPLTAELIARCELGPDHRILHLAGEFPPRNSREPVTDAVVTEECETYELHGPVNDRPGECL